MNKKIKVIRCPEDTFKAIRTNFDPILFTGGVADSCTEFPIIATFDSLKSHPKDIEYLMQIFNRVGYFSDTITADNLQHVRMIIVINGNADVTITDRVIKKIYAIHNWKQIVSRSKILSWFTNKFIKLRLNSIGDISGILATIQQTISDRSPELLKSMSSLNSVQYIEDYYLDFNLIYYNYLVIDTIYKDNDTGTAKRITNMDGLLDIIIDSDSADRPLMINQIVYLLNEYCVHSYSFMKNH